MDEQTNLGNEGVEQPALPTEAPEASGALENDDQQETIDQTDPETSGDHESQADEGNGEVEEPDEVEFNFNGEKLRIPRDSIPEELSAKVDEFVRNAESTTGRKLSEAADMRKQVEAAREELIQRAQVSEALVNQRAGITALDRELAQYEGVNWQEWSNQDPMAAQQAHFAKQQLQDERNDAIQKYQQAEQEFANSRATQTREAKQKMVDTLAKEIPGWGPEKDQEITQFAVNDLGIPPQRVASITSATEVLILNELKELREFKAKVTQARPSKPKPEEAQPVSKVRGKKQSANKNPDDMSPDEWLTWRTSQISKRA